MKFLTLRFPAALLTFALGVIVFWIAHQKYIFQQPESVQPIIAKQAVTPETKPERFVFLSHACGRGWADGYEMPDGQRLSTGLMVFDSPGKAQSELLKTISQAERIITTVEKYKKPNGEIGKRTVANFVSKKSSESRVAIFWRQNGKDSYEYIYAPTLEIALEFEQYLNK